MKSAKKNSQERNNARKKCYNGKQDQVWKRIKKKIELQIVCEKKKEDVGKRKIITNAS
jgi:hypothetical protein